MLRVAGSDGADRAHRGHPSQGAQVLAGELRARHDQRGRAVGGGADVQLPQRVGDHRAGQYVLDRRLAGSKYVAGPTYTIADIAIFPWYGGLAKFNQYGAAEFLDVQSYKNVQRWCDVLLARPAVKRGRMVNRLQGDPSEQLHERHDASDFETKTQDKLAAVS